MLARARTGTLVTFVPGNHDQHVRRFCGAQLGNLVVVREAVHRLLDGRLLLVIHGDELAAATASQRWSAWTGDLGYTAVVTVERWLDRARRRLRPPPWRLPALVRMKLAVATSFVSTFERELAAEARRRNFHGVVCGHVHKAAVRDIEGVLYCNAGDWVDSCTAIAERFDGKLELLSPAGAPVAALEPALA